MLIPGPYIAYQLKSAFEIAINLILHTHFWMFVDSFGSQQAARQGQSVSEDARIPGVHTVIINHLFLTLVSWSI